MTRGRGLIGAVLIVAILATLGMQTLVRQKREALAPRPRSISRLTGLDTFALGLILGGLRGPLVMLLWSSSENQKIDRNLEDIDTKIELIRMLQPEFDSVHIFQIWNKAYNLSVYMASLPNKYATILDAVDYAHSVDAERPDNVNILTSMADLYFNKLGNSAEKKYYISRVRQETLPHQRPTPSRRGERGWRRSHHDAMLDKEGYILPQYLEPKPEFAGAAAGAYNGAELQALARYSTPELGGFPYGLSPLAIGYNYYKRANQLMAATGQKHLQLSDNVIDSRPAVSLKFWAEEEWQRARRSEIRAYGKQEPEERIDLEPVTAGQPLNAAFADNADRARQQVQEALFSYRRMQQVSRHAIAEYKRHLANEAYAYNADAYFSHMDSAQAMDALGAADHDFLVLAAMTAGLQPMDAVRAAELRASAMRHYQEAANRILLMLLKYTVTDAVADVVYPAVTKELLGKEYHRATIQNADPKVYAELYNVVLRYRAGENVPDEHAEDTREFQAYLSRAVARLETLKS